MAKWRSPDLGKIADAAPAQAIATSLNFAAFCL